MNRAKQTVVDCSTCELSFVSLYSCLATTWLVGVCVAELERCGKEREVQVLISLSLSLSVRGVDG